MRVACLRACMHTVRRRARARECVFASAVVTVCASAWVSGFCQMLCVYSDVCGIALSPTCAADSLSDVHVELFQRICHSSAPALQQLCAFAAHVPFDMMIVLRGPQQAIEQ